jgi:hypothetical protein
MMFKSWEGWMKFGSDVRLPPPVQLKVHWASSLTPSPPTKKYEKDRRNKNKEVSKISHTKIFYEENFTLS